MRSAGISAKSDAARDLVSAVEALRLNRIYFTPRVASMVLDGYLQRENGSPSSRRSAIA